MEWYDRRLMMIIEKTPEIHFPSQFEMFSVYIENVKNLLDYIWFSHICYDFFCLQTKQKSRKPTKVYTINQK